MLKKIGSIPQFFRLPGICPLCQQYHHESTPVCSDCKELFIPIKACCQHCALPLADSTFLLCGQCIKHPPAFDKVIAAYQFAEPLRSLLHEFKYREGLFLSSFLAQLILPSISEVCKKTQCLIPVPIHPKRLRQRGFNQAAELAKQLSKKLNIPYQLTLCKKQINTPPQAGLDALARKRNLKNAFFVKPNAYAHVTIIDDLLTTGSTANELAHILKQQGIKQVDVWCCARAGDVGYF